MAQDHLNVKLPTPGSSPSSSYVDLPHKVSDNTYTGDEDEPRKSVEDFLAILLRHTKKYQNFRRLPFYLVFLGMLVANVSIVKLEFTRATEFYRNAGSKVSLQSKKFEGVLTTDEYWKWLEETVDTLWKEQASTIGPSRYLSFAVLRQLRVDSRPIDTSATYPIAPSIRRFLHNRTSQPYHDDHASTTAMVLKYQGQVKRFESNAETDVTGIKAEGTLAYYGSPEKAFTVYFPLPPNGTASEAVDKVRELRRFNWIDGYTRVVYFEMLNYNKLQGTYLITSMMLEVSHTGFLFPRVVNLPIVHHNFWRSSFIAVAVLDVLILLHCISEFLDFLRTSYSNYSEVGEGLISQFGWWAAFLVLDTVLFILAYIDRGRLWYLGWSQSDPASFYSEEWEKYGSNEALGKEKAMWDIMVTTAELFDSYMRWIALAVVLAWIRLLGYFRQTERFGVLSETLSNSSNMLFGWLVSFAIIFIPHAIAASLLYGSNIRAFRSVVETIWSLLFFVSRGEIGVYESMEREHTLWTPLFLTTFVAFVWLIMVNMFIAIITGTFQSVQAKRKDDSSHWKASVVLKGVKTFVLGAIVQLANTFRGRREKERGNRQSQQEKDVRSLQSRDYYQAIGELRELGVGKDGGVVSLAEVKLTRQQFYERMGRVLPRRLVNKLFDKLIREHAANTNFIKVSERWAVRTRKRVDNLDTIQPRMTELIPSMALTNEASNQSELVREETIKLGARIDRVKGTVADTVPSRAALQSNLQPIDEAKSTVKKMDTMVEGFTRSVRQVRSLVGRTEELHATIKHVRDNMRDKVDFLLNGIKRGFLFGLTPSQYSSVAPAIVESRPGKGSVGLVEKLSYPARTEKEKDEAFDKWLAHKVGESAVKAQRDTEMEELVATCLPSSHSTLRRRRLSSPPPTHLNPE